MGSRILREFKGTLSWFSALVLIMSQLVFPIVAVQTVSAAHPTPAYECVTDTAGADDEPNQKDLNELCIDDTHLPAEVDVTWNWDDTGTPGNNTMDGCALFDTDNDGLANYSVCVTTNNNPATLTSTILYSCGDARPDRCSQPATPQTISGNTSCSVVSPSADDPFHAGGNDTKAICTLDLADVGGSGVANLIDVCSYPSGEPNSDPSDCVIIQDYTAFIRLVKQIEPESDPGLFNLLIDGVVYATDVSDNQGTAIIPVDNGGNQDVEYDVSETAGTNTDLGDYTSQVQCVVTETTQQGPVVTPGPVVPGTSSSVTVGPGDLAVCTFTNTEVPDATLILEKTVINDDGGTLTQSDFPVAIDGNSASWGTNTIEGGSYVVSETTQPGYAAGDWGGDCDANGNVTLVPGETKTCTITNDDIAPTLFVQKNVTNDNGGTANSSEFDLFLNGIAVTNPVATDVPTNATDNYTRYATIDVVAGVAQTVSEDQTDPAGYAQTAIICTDITDSQNQIVVGNGFLPVIGHDYACRVFNDDVTPTLTLLKTVVNDHGGTATQDDFQARIDGNAVSWDIQVPVDANAEITVSEDTANNYAAGDWGGDCDADGTITLSPGQNATCTITNDDIAPKITVVKYVTNDDGGTLAVGDFPLYVADQLVVSGVQNDWTAGTVTVTEQTQAGYAFTGFGGDCDVNGNVTLEIGGVYTCTISNDDQPATIIVNKVVVNDDGGSATASDFTLKVNATEVVDGASNTFDGNETYTISEVPLISGYAQTSIVCNDITGAVPVPVDNGFTAQLGHTYDCTITNDDIAPTLTLVKTVVNDNGGGLTKADFQAKIDGNNVDWDAAQTLAVGPHTASEVQADGYSASDWTGDCDADGTITLAPGDEATCYITNDDKAGSITLVKTVVNNDGGDAAQDDFQAYIGVVPVDWSTPIPVAAGNYTASEDTLLGYDDSDWSGDCDQSGNVYVGNGQNVTCYITNDDIPATLTLVKKVITNDGGDATQDQWTLTAQGASLLQGQDQTASLETGVSGQVSAGQYILSESTGPEGYQLTSIVCNDVPVSLDTPTIEVNLNDDMTCVFTNDDIAPTLKVVKYATNDDGGDVYANQFNLYVNDVLLTNGSGGSVNATTTYHSYGPDAVQANVAQTITEDPEFGYLNTYINCYDTTNGLPGSIVGNGFTPLEGHTYMCNVGNNDIAPTLKLVKTVVNDDGGTAVQGDFQAYISGSPVGWDQATSVVANQVLTASESNITGYAAGDWAGACNDDGTVTLKPGENLTCTITNDDIAPRLTLKKIVIDEYGSGYEAEDWTLYANPESADAVLSGNGDDGVDGEKAVANVVYKLSEEGPAGFDPSDWDCYGEGFFRQADDRLLLKNGSDVTCVITNDAVAPHLIVIKHVINDDHLNPDYGKKAGDFTMYVDGIDASKSAFPGEEAPGTEVTLDVGEYKVTEDEDAAKEMGYAISYSDDCSGQISLAETKTCIVTNDDIPPKLRLVKHAVTVNDPVMQEFELFAQQGENMFESPYTVDVNPETEEVMPYAVIDSEDGLKAGPVSIGENVPENWILADIRCSDSLQVEFNQFGVQEEYSKNVKKLKLHPGDDVTCVFKNLEKAKVNVTKYWDVNQDGVFDESESTLPDWQFDLERCRRYENEPTNLVVPQDENQELPHDIGCTRFVVGENFVEGRGQKPPHIQSKVTDENGLATFSGLKPYGLYELSEVFQDGWNISGMDCEYGDYRDDSLRAPFAPNSYLIHTYPGAEIDCYVGNYQDGLLQIEKTNNRIGDQLTAGDEIVYTITVTNPENSGILYNTITYDLLPEKISYVAGSGVASSSVRGAIASPLDGNDYEVAGPATWELGSLVPGEVVTLTYSGTVDEGTEPGVYDNIAFAEAESCHYQPSEYPLLPPSPPREEGPFEFNISTLAPQFDVPEDDSYDENPCPFGIAFYPSPEDTIGAQAHNNPFGAAVLVSLYANQIDGEGDPFVDSSVEIVEPTEPQGFVLGIQTLAYTGVQAILPAAVGLVVAGAALALAAGKKRRFAWEKITRGLKVFTIAFVLSLFVSGNSLAATGPGWQLKVVDLPAATTSNSIEISYQVISVDSGDTFTTTLIQDGIAVESQVINTPFGDAGTFTVNGLSEGSHTFKVVSENSDDPTNKTNSQTIKVDTTAPSGLEYKGVNQDGNRFTLTFTVPAGSDVKTVKIYSSKSQEFTADSSTLIGEVAATPGVEQQFVYEAANDDPRYFALEQIDDAGNASPLVGDEETIVTGGTSTATTTAANGDSSSETDSDGNEEVLGEDNQDGENNEDGDGEETNDGINTALILVGAGAAVVILWYFLQQRRSSK